MHKELFKTITDKLNFSLRHKTPVILQSEAAECGIACLAMVCGFYGLNIDLFNFRHRYGSPSQGVTLMSLSKTAEHAGLKSRALSLDLDEIKQLKLPCVIHWGLNHYVVLTKVRKSSFIVHDPALGKRVIGIQEMSNNFTGVALELWPDQNFQQEQAKSRLRLLDLMRNIVGLKSVLLKIFAFSVVVEAIGLLLLRFSHLGPLALLPLPGECRRSVVWPVKKGTEDEWLGDENDQHFLDALQQTYGDRAGKFQKTGKRFSFPLAQVLAEKQAVGRVILMGNAAHTIHPVAGQGFNLCMRDADVLMRYITTQIAQSDDIGQPEMLKAYEQSRLTDQQRVIKFCDSVVRGFSNQNPVLKLLRNTGLVAFDVIPGIKPLVANYAMGLKA